MDKFIALAGDSKLITNYYISSKQDVVKRRLLGQCCIADILDGYKITEILEETNYEIYYVISSKEFRSESLNIPNEYNVDINRLNIIHDIRKDDAGYEMNCVISYRVFDVDMSTLAEELYKVVETVNMGCVLDYKTTCLMRSVIAQRSLHRNRHIAAIRGYCNHAYCSLNIVDGWTVLKIKINGSNDQLNKLTKLIVEEGLLIKYISDIVNEEGIVVEMEVSIVILIGNDINDAVSINAEKLKLKKKIEERLMIPWKN